MALGAAQKCINSHGLLIWQIRDAGEEMLLRRLLCSNVPVRTDRRDEDEEA